VQTLTKGDLTRASTFLNEGKIDRKNKQTNKEAQHRTGLKYERETKSEEAGVD
jgi:hypothetical protein